MQWFKVVFVGLLLVFSANLAVAQGTVQNTGKLSGVLVNRKTQQNVAGLLVSLTPSGEKMISDSNGAFRFTSLLPGTYAIKITGLGIQEKLLTNVIVTSGNENTFTIELEPTVNQLNAVTVSSRRNTAKATTLESPLSIQRLTAEEIKANPGGNFDISKVIQSLPGVGGGAAGGTFRNDIIIRGGAPSENVFYLDGIEVPIINHFSTQGSGGGPQGILNVSFIQDVKLSTSAFDARYDNTLSSVFQFRQKNGNANKLQGNFRMSGTEVAATLDGPLSKRTTFLASVRRSYLELLFKALDLPIRPNYWDYQFKTTTKINDKTTLTTLGLAAIDEFRLAAPKEATPEKLFAINNNPLVNQWNYTLGVSLKKLIQDGYWNLSISRNTLDNQADRYEDNEKPSDATRTYQIRSNETENKLRFDVTKNINNIHCINYALGATEGEIDFYSNNHSHASSALIVSDFQKAVIPETLKTKQIKVDVNTLDKITTTLNIQSPILLKMDVQGFEKKVLEGGINFINKVDYLLFEASFISMYDGEALFEEMHTIVKNLGFELIAPTGFLQSKNLQVLQMDMLYKKSKK